MLSRNTLTTTAIIGFLLGATASGFVYKKANDAFDVMFGIDKNKKNKQDDIFLKFIATYGFVGSVASVSAVGLFSKLVPVVADLVSNKSISCDI